ncbi:MAG: acyl-CoA reductase [Bacteroidetes bacterium]|nr:acyl-CoA reductase [Bacteroidota bacterium]
MTLENRIKAFHLLGEKIRTLSSNEKENLFEKVANENPWFIAENVDQALKGVSKFLDQKVLETWLGNYSIKNSSKKIGVAMAGNIPLVGFHDLLCVLLSGHQLVAKLSSSDSVLLKFIKDSLIELNPEFKEKIVFEERLKGVDAVIATGSDNTSRYFEYYFRNIPHIIRKNRTSCAVILGEESSEEFSVLGKDIFSYFGLGCRNVSKIYVPENFDFPSMLKNWDSFQPIINHHKYANNYDYQKSILLINQIHFYDNGFLLLTKSENLVSPISTIYYESYKDQDDLTMKLKLNAEKIQCIVSARGWFRQSIPFGEAQFPTVDDYADRIDTIKFLQSV